MNPLIWSSGDSDAKTLTNPHLIRHIDQLINVGNRILSYMKHKYLIAIAVATLFLITSQVSGVLPPEARKERCLESGGEWEDSKCICPGNSTALWSKCWVKSPKEVCGELGGKIFHGFKVGPQGSNFICIKDISRIVNMEQSGQGWESCKDSGGIPVMEKEGSCVYGVDITQKARNMSLSGVDSHASTTVTITPTPHKTKTSESGEIPGFESFFTVAGLALAVYLARKQ